MLNPTRMLEFLDEKIRSLGTAACPPYHLAIVVGGTSAEYALKTAKYASANYLDGAADVGLDVGPRRSATSSWRQKVLRADAVVRDRRAVRRQVLLPRRARGPAAAARRLVPGRDRGVVLGRPAGARQDHRGGRLPRAARARPGALPARDDRRPPRRRRRGQDRPQPADGRDPRGALSAYPVKTRLSLTGPLVVARDIAHAKIKERLDAGEPMPAVPARPRASTTPGRRRRRRATRRDRSGRRRPAGWTRTSTSSRRPAGRW